jgi:hypothetical protein
MDGLIMVNSVPDLFIVYHSYLAAGLRIASSGERQARFYFSRFDAAAAG